MEGDVEEYTLAELRAMPLKNTAEPVHTLTEHLLYAKSKGMSVNIDLKPAFVDNGLGWFERNKKNLLPRTQETNELILVF